MLLLQLLIGGLAQGCVYGLTAMGIVLIYQASQTISLAQGEWMLLGTWLTLLCTTGWDWPYWLGAVVAFLSVGVLAWVMERVLVRPLRTRPGWLIAALTLAVALGVRKLVIGLGSASIPTTTLPSPNRDAVWMLGDLALRAEHLAAIGITAAMCTALFALFRFTKVGFAMHAALHNRLAARHMGLPVRHLDGATWVLAALLAVAAGLLLATWAPVDGDMALAGFKALPAALLGGFFRLRGAMLGGLLIGGVEAVASAALPEPWQDSPAFVLGLLAIPFIRRGRT